MSDAPERIWFERDDVAGWLGYAEASFAPEATGYVRADIHDAAQARIAELEAALIRIAAGDFSLTPPPDYITNPAPSPQQIARRALEAKP